VGFIDSILGFGKKIIGGLFGGGAATAVARQVIPRVGAAAAAQRVGASAARIARAGAGAVALGAGFAVGESIFSPEQQEALAAQGGMGGGNGFSFRRTIVQTIRSFDGVILNIEVLRGAPHLMNRDLQTAKRVFRISSKLGARLPKKMVRMSRTKMLMQSLQESALERAISPPAMCPPKC